MNEQQRKHYPVIIIGGGQAGLSASYYLQQKDIDHLVIEKNDALNSWKYQRWDSFSLVTPNWQCALPGHPYEGNDPHGFMVKDEIIDYLNVFEKKVNAPIKAHTAVTKVVAENSGVLEVSTDNNVYSASHIIVATGGYGEPIIPRMAERVPREVYQLHSEQYKNSEQLPEGAVLVVGSGQSGAQIAEDLLIAGRKVFLATGNAPRCARFYRGRDVVDWLADMKYYDMPVEEHPLKEGVRDNTNHYVTGRDGGRDIDLRAFAMKGMELFGALEDFETGTFRFSPSLKNNLDAADSTYNNINKRIDAYIDQQCIEAPAGKCYEPLWHPMEERETLALASSGIQSILWCIGFKTNYSWLDVPIFNGRGYPLHKRGVTTHPGVYFLGLPWQHTWGSGRFSGIARDADYICDQISDSLRALENRKSA